MAHTRFYFINFICNFPVIDLCNGSIIEFRSKNVSIIFRLLARRRIGYWQVFPVTDNFVEKIIMENPMCSSQIIRRAIRQGKNYYSFISENKAADKLRWAGCSFLSLRPQIEKIKRFDCDIVTVVQCLFSCRWKRSGKWWCIKMECRNEMAYIGERGDKENFLLNQW